MTLWSAGDELESRRIGDVSPAAMRTMSVVLADPNPIHLDVEAVRELGLGDRLVNQGPTNLGYVIDMVRQNFPEGKLVRFQARMLATVHAGDEVVAGGVVESAGPADQEDRVVCRVWLDIVGGPRAVEAAATVAIR